jgi:chorismate mutase
VGTTTATAFVNTAKSVFQQGYTTDSNTTTLSTQRTSGLFFVDAGGNSNNQGSYCSIVAVANTGSATNPGALFRGYSYVSSVGTLQVQINYNGDITNTNNSYGAISDANLKENIVDATPKLADLMQVQVRNYNLKADTKKVKQIGVIAQELEAVFPSMIEADGDGLKNVKYSVFVPMLIKAIQEQQALIESLTQRLTALESK